MWRGAASSRDGKTRALRSGAAKEIVRQRLSDSFAERVYQLYKLDLDCLQLRRQTNLSQLSLSLHAPI